MTITTEHMQQQMAETLHAADAAAFWHLLVDNERVGPYASRFEMRYEPVVLPNVRAKPATQGNSGTAAYPDGNPRITG